MKVNKKSFSKKLCLGIVLAAATLAILAVTYNSAYAVRVSLKRVVFDEKKRSEILTLINNTAEPKTYRLGWRKYRMTEEASLQNIEEGQDASDILWADDMIRYAPRRVTIPPGGSQQIRLLLRRPKDIQNAEYRAHLWIVSESKPEAFTGDDKKQAIRLAVQPAISLPVFVRHGKLSASASITDAKLSRTDDGLKVSLNLNREGNRSVYGDFDFTCNAGGEELVLKQVRGIAVYTDIQTRRLDFDIPTAENRAANCSTVNIVYRADPNDFDAVADTIAEATATY